MTLSEMLSVLQGRKIDPETGEESPGGTSPYMNIAMGQSQSAGLPSPGSIPSGQASLLQLPQLPQGQAPVRAESLPGPAGGIMGPQPDARTQFTDVSGGGLMNPVRGQGPRDMSQGMQAGMPQMPGPQQRGLAGLMGMAPQVPQQQQEPNTQGAKMKEYLRGLLYG